MSDNDRESTDVVEIDAIGVDEWERDQHTPRAMDENLAALVKQSSAESGPARAPTLDDSWDVDGEPAKQRTTTNTVARPAPPKTKTMALPTVAAVAPKANAVPQAVARVETKAIVSPAAKKLVATTHPGDEPPPGFVEVKPLAARGLAKPSAKPMSKPVAEPKPIAKSAAKPTPPSLAKVDPKPLAAIAPKPMAAIEPKPAARAPTPLPFAPMTLPAWPPANEFEDWDNPQSAATSVGNRISPSRPVSSDFKPEDSVIVDLNAKPAATVEKPRRSSPVIQTSAQNPSTSGAFVMPTAAQPNATLVAPERASAPELPAPPVALIGDRASSPGWTTPLPQRLPGEPLAAPAAPGWPSATNLAYEPSAPPAHEPAAPLAAKRSIIAALVRSRGVVIAMSGACVLAIVFAIGSHGSHDAKPAPVTPPIKPTVTADSAAQHVTPPRAGAMPALAQTAAVEPVAPPPKSPAKRPVALRRISRSKKPVVVDYGKKPSSSALEPDEALAQARAAYSIGNQHLFAGEGGEAVSAYRKALEIYPSYAAGYRGLGLAFAQLDDKPSAIAAFKTYVKLAPSAKDVALIQKRIRNLSVR